MLNFFFGNALIPLGFFLLKQKCKNVFVFSSVRCYVVVCFSFSNIKMGFFFQISVSMYCVAMSIETTPPALPLLIHICGANKVPIGGMSLVIEP